jgi:signal recognition particle subunit SRP54
MMRQHDPDDHSLDDLRRDLANAMRLNIADALRVLPQYAPVQLPTADDDARDMRRLEGIIDAMTKEEREHPTEIIDSSRCWRIATGAGVSISDVSELVSQFRELRKIMKRIKGMRRM